MANADRNNQQMICSQPERATHSPRSSGCSASRTASRSGIWLSCTTTSRAYFAQEHGDDAGFQAELRACYLVLHQMQQRSLHFDPTLAQVYQQLAGMFGTGPRM